MEEIGRDPRTERPEPSIEGASQILRPFNRIDQRSPESIEESTAAPSRGAPTLIGLVVLASSLLALSLNEAFGYINIAVGCLLTLGGMANLTQLKK